MTPTQTKRRIAVMQKHGEPGWRIEIKLPNSHHWDLLENPDWSNPHCKYRAVRVTKSANKRVPLPWSTIRCGMVVKRKGETRIAAVDEIDGAGAWAGRGSSYFSVSNFLDMHYLDGDEWKPLWTETEGDEIVEIVSEEEP